ncbi:uricase [Drosophila grimshawi]|uniref:Uricase n=1 Tax=Drosophila grimshawi TaxID=7222 RepID=B4JEU7_DROGR|nr:uricase [Drosophila grimshawi]EDV93228.1 GH19188 [Drosophila grimshawi]
MFPSPLQNYTKLNAPTAFSHEQQSPYEIVSKSYGKDAVKVLHVNRRGPVHTIQELEVGTHLKLNSNKDYVLGVNSDVVATDSQKNTVYLLAKKYGVESPEKFALIVGNHFLSKYAHVEEAHVHVEAYPWQRIHQKNQQSQPHNHAFLFSPTAEHYCDVIVRRQAPKQTVISGIRGLRVLKTTQSSFVNFVDDEYRSLADQSDRIFSTVVECAWEYSCTKSVDFLSVWQTVKDIILKNFAGDPNVGIYSPSVQNTLYLSEKDVLDVVPQVAVITMTMPNKHYFTFDTKPFQQVAPGENNEVFIPTDKPHGTIHAVLGRKDLKSHL